MKVEEQNHNYVLKEDEVTLAHKDKQIELFNEITGGKLQKHVDAESKTRLARGDSQRKDIDEEKHSYVMLMKCDEKMKLLEELLRETRMNKKLQGINMFVFAY